MGQIPCTNNDSVPTAELKVDDIVIPPTSNSDDQVVDSEISTKPEFGSYDEKLRLEDITPSMERSPSNSLGRYRPFEDRDLESGRPVEELKIDSIQDCSSDIEPSTPKKYTYSSTYRLVKDEIGHRRLNPQAAPSRARYAQPWDAHRSKERVDLASPSTGTSIPRSREDVASSAAPTQARSQPRFQGSWFGRRSSRSHSRGDRQNRTNRPNRVGRMEGPQNFDMYIRSINNSPLFVNFERGTGAPQAFSFARGFDNDGFFFFTVNISPQGRQRPTEATKSQIEKAVSQLKGLTSDLEIKKGDKCPICLEQFRTTDDVVEMPCPCKRTFFHRQCAIDTLEKTKKIKCPNCRRWDNITKDSESEVGT